MKRTENNWRGERVGEKRVGGERVKGERVGRMIQCGVVQKRTLATCILATLYFTRTPETSKVT